jgi:hypothetical protein
MNGVQGQYGDQAGNQPINQDDLGKARTGVWFWLNNVFATAGWLTFTGLLFPN